MELKLVAEDVRAADRQLRGHLNEIRGIEKAVMQRCVRDAGMPRSDFIETFPRNETNLHWLDKHIRAKRKHSAKLGRLREDIEREQKSCAGSRSARTCRLARSRRSTARSRWARPRRAARRRKWSRPTCAS
jgi:hypothetical protein